MSVKINLKEDESDIMGVTLLSFGNKLFYLGETRKYDKQRKLHNDVSFLDSQMLLHKFSRTTPVLLKPSCYNLTQYLQIINNVKGVFSFQRPLKSLINL